MVVTLPFLLLLLDFWPLRRFQLNTGTWKLKIYLLLEKAPFFALAALDCAMTVWAQRAEAMTSLEVLPFGNRIANALVSYVLYLWKAVWPRHLTVLYPYSHEWTFLESAAAALFLWRSRFGLFERPGGSLTCLSAGSGISAPSFPSSASCRSARNRGPTVTRISH